MQEVNGSRKVWLSAVIAMVLLAAGLAAAWWLGRPAYHRFKEKRSMTQAREFLQQGDLRNAVLALRQAQVLNPNNVEAARLMAELAAEAQSPMALPLWRRVVELSPTIEHQTLLAAIALRVEQPPFPTAAQTLEDIGPAGETNISFHLVASQLAIKLKRYTDATTHLEAAARLDPTNRLHELNLATLRLQFGDPALVENSRAEIVALTSDARLGEYALRSLVADALLRGETNAAIEFSDQLLALPQATFDDRLQHATVLQAVRNAELSGWLRRVQDEAATNALRVTQTVAWMNREQLAQAALDWLATLPPALRTAMPVPLAETDAYVALKDWPGLEARLEAQNWEEQDFIRLAWMARALREQRQSSMADLIWRRAVSAAGSRAGTMAVLAQIAGSWGWTEEAENLLWLNAKKETQADWPLQTLLRNYSARNDSAGQFRVYQELLARHPDSVPLKNNVAMFDLLLNETSPRAQALAREVYEAGRTNAIFVSTYAFALHLDGNTAEALDLMRQLPAPELERPEIAIYYALFLAASGDTNQAKTYAALARKSLMLPEEERLLSGIR